MYKKYKVVKKIRESSLVFSLYIQPADAEPLEKFLPGQHLLFRFTLPECAIPLFRNYSFSDAYNPMHYRVSIKKESGTTGGPGCKDGVCSSFIFHHLNEGDLLEAKGPQGNFVMDALATHPVVMMAGGIGITPLLCMIKSIAAQHPLRRVAFFYGINDRAHHAFREEIKDLKQQYPSFDIFTFYSSVNEADEAGVDFDFSGFIDLSLLHSDFTHPMTEFYLCGPAAMMESLTRQLKTRGISPENIHSESFLAPVGESLDELVPAAAQTVLPRVAYSRLGKTLEWDSRFKSLLEFSEANDIEISSGCLFGDCGTCLTGLQKGEVKYLHPTMVKPLPGECLPCSCFPMSDIVLDL